MISPKAVLVKTSLVDFPGRVAATVFLFGCNFRCPYCYNVDLVAPKNDAKNTDNAPGIVSIQEVIFHLQKRKNVLTGLVISGGEPLCHPDLVSFLIKNARSLGYKIKLDTNGSFPDRLRALTSDESLCPDYIALDVKTSPARYADLSTPLRSGRDDNATAISNAACGERSRTIEKSTAPEQGQASIQQKIIESIKILSALPAATREFRTVLYPPLVGREEIKEIAGLLPKDAAWFFAHFRNENCISPEAENTAPYTDDQEAALVECAKEKISGAQLR